MAKIIRFGEPIEIEIPIAPQPSVHLKTKNLVQSQDAVFRVYFVKGIHKKIWDHINDTPRIESGGVLVGHPFRSQEDDRVFVVITGAIPQDSRNRGVAHFTVGPEETAAVRQEIEEQYPGQVAVGWYHSHPGHGVFLSGQDMVIVRSIYNASWHIALVIDPSRKEEGLFIGPNGEQLGPPGGQEFGTSWEKLLEIPDSLKAIALYNQAQDAFEAGRVHDAKHAIEELLQLIKNREELSYWHVASKLTELKTKIAESVANATVAEPPEVVSNGPSYPTLEGSRQPASPTLAWLLIAVGSTFIFATTLLTVAFFFQETSTAIVTSWGILLSTIAIFFAGYTIVHQPSNSHVNSNRTRQGPPNSSRAVAHRILSLGIISIVLILWGTYIVLPSYNFSDKASLDSNEVDRNVAPRTEVRSTSMPQTRTMISTEGTPPATTTVTVTLSAVYQDGITNGLVYDISSTPTPILIPTVTHLPIKSVSETTKITSTTDLSNTAIVTSSTLTVTDAITNFGSPE